MDKARAIYFGVDFEQAVLAFIKTWNVVKLRSFSSMAANVMESSNLIIFAADDEKSETCKLMRNVIPRFGKTPSVAHTNPCLALVN
ncbi:unnamed protein product [Clonostachys solani]|uniref:Uncharacterized protein n=1 Tax=Clonostachys solani TaxID=160281 RepID=A0A9N9ZFE9_9HYPO|nr:unnamed protein product [Clonostachys solani]